MATRTSGRWRTQSSELPDGMKAGRLGPIVHLWLQLDRDKQSILRAPTRWWSLAIGMLYLIFYLPSHRSYHTGQWKDVFRFFRNWLGVKQSRQGITFYVSGPRPVGERKGEMVKKSAHLAWQELSRLAFLIYSRFLWSVHPWTAG